jgi:hypothetical protein
LFGSELFGAALDFLQEKSDGILMLGIFRFGRDAEYFFADLDGKRVIAGEQNR